MSIEVDDLEVLYDVYCDALDNLTDGWDDPASKLAVLLSSPPPDMDISTLDAWADYLIAKRRYERALVMSRRGVEI